MIRFIVHLAEVWKNSGRILVTEKQIDRITYLKVESRILTRLRKVLVSLQNIRIDSINMDLLSKITPPDCVKGMTQLKREAFTKIVKVPAIKIPKSEINKTEKIWKPLQLKIRELKPIAELSDDDPDKKTHSLILLDPDKLQTGSFTDGQKSLLQSIGFDIKHPETFEVTLHYNNWTLPDIMRAVLPSDTENVTSFTQIGHIAHLNLKPESLPYKNLIGEVIVDKLRTVKTVVNKVGTIDNTYRNFAMELLAGEHNYITQIKEHNLVFELDFSKVYWNSRLSTEHQRIVDIIETGSIVYDVFAGIGPFTVPLAKRKRCHVFANDLNPSSFEYLNRNIQLNKIAAGRTEVFNLDGHDFIKSVIKKDLINRITKITHENLQTFEGNNEIVKSSVEDNSSHSYLPNTEINKPENIAVPPSYVIMNLPAIAVEFLESFKSLLEDLPSKLKSPHIIQPLLPHIFCYMFTQKNNFMEDIQARFTKATGQPLPDDCDVRTVRNVAPNKDMVCISFKLWLDLVLGLCDDDKKGSENSSESCKEPESKRQKLAS